jgi:tRNA 2-thiouridine synthesizing protein A
MTDVANAPSRVVDARGHKCPVPSLRLRKALEEVAIGDVVELWADDPMVKIDIPHLVRSLHDRVVFTDLSGAHSIFWVMKCSPSSPPA